MEQFDSGRFHKIAALDDQWLRGISGIVETPEGDLWLNAISGIFHIRKSEISEALKDSAYRVKGEHFDRREGLSGIPSQVHPLPTAIEGSDGRLWFTLRNGVVWLDPGDAEREPEPERRPHPADHALGHDRRGRLHRGHARTPPGPGPGRGHELPGRVR